MIFVCLFSQTNNKRRVHFNSFMVDVHARIHEVRKTIVRDETSTKPQPFDPIPPVARSLSNQAWLICFDEFQVSKRYEIIFFNETFERSMLLLSGVYYSEY